MLSYKGACVVAEMTKFWKTVDAHVTLGMGVKVSTEKPDSCIWLCPILPPSVPCSRCEKSHTMIRFEQVMQIGLKRLTLSRAKAMAND